MKKNFIGALLLVFLSIMMISSNVFASQAMDSLKKSVNTVLDTLKNSEFQNKDKLSEKRKKIWKAVDGIFSFSIMSKKTIGSKNWNKLNENEQKKFSDLFGKFLGNIYYTRLEKYTNETVTFERELEQSATLTIIKTVIKSNTLNIPMDYSMINDNGWKVYDVNIEGVSLVRNYRSQFHKIIRDKGMGHLMKMMEEKLGFFKDL